MDWANIKKILTPLSAKRYFPRWRVRAENNSSAGNGQLYKVIADIAQRDENELFLFHGL